MKFKKRGLVGFLKLVTVDHVTKSDSGNILSSAQFRSNATKKAADFFVSEGWALEH